MAVIKQATRGNLFKAGNDKIIVSTNSAEIKIKAKDYWGNERELKTISGPLDDVTVDLGITEPGYYEIYIYNNEDGLESQVLAKTAAAVVASFDFDSYTSKQSDFGISGHFMRKRRGSPLMENQNTVNVDSGWKIDMINEVALLGAKFIRDSVVGWEEFERGKKGNYGNLLDFEEHMEFKRLMDKYGMDICVPTPYRHSLYDGGVTPYTQDGWDGYANFIAEFVKQYNQLPGSSKIIAIEVYNEFWLIGQVMTFVDGPARIEPGGTSTVTGTVNPSTTQPYADPVILFNMQKTVYEKLREDHDNDDIVILTNFCGDGRWVHWYERLLELGTGNYMDGLFPHPYYQNSTPESILLTKAKQNGSFQPFIYKIEYVHNEIKKNYGYDLSGKAIWVTEQGTSTGTGGNNSADEREQARFVPRSYSILKSRGIEKMSWYDLMDDGMNKADWEDNYGFIRNMWNSEWGGYTPKPAFAAYAAMTRKLTNSEFIGMEELIPSNGIGYRANANADHSNDVFLHKFIVRDPNNENEKYVNTVWSMREMNVELETDEPVIFITDIMGRETAHVPENGRIIIKVTPDLQYITGMVSLAK